MPPTQDNLYEGGKSDARQTTRAHLEASEGLFRPRYRKLTEAEIDLHDRIKTQAAVLAALFYEVEPIHAGPSRNRERGANVQLAIRNLEDAVYRAVKGLTGPTMESEKASVDERLAKAQRLRDDLNKAANSRAEPGDEVGRAGPIEQDVQAAEQRQLDEGRLVEASSDMRAGGGVSDHATKPYRLDGIDLGDRMLVGSDAFPSHILIGIEDVQLGVIVVRAQSRSGYSVEGWNGASQVLRDKLIGATIEAMREERKAAYIAGLDPAQNGAAAPAAVVETQIGAHTLVEATAEGRGDYVRSTTAPLTQDGAAATQAATRPVDAEDGRGSSGDAAVVTAGPQPDGQTA